MVVVPPTVVVGIVAVVALSNSIFPSQVFVPEKVVPSGTVVFTSILELLSESRLTVHPEE